MGDNTVYLWAGARPPTFRTGAWDLLQTVQSVDIDIYHGTKSVHFFHRARWSAQIISGGVFKCRLLPSFVVWPRHVIISISSSVISWLIYLTTPVPCTNQCPFSHLPRRACSKQLWLDCLKHGLKYLYIYSAQLFYAVLCSYNLQQGNLMNLANCVFPSYLTFAHCWIVKVFIYSSQLTAGCIMPAHSETKSVCASK